MPILTFLFSKAGLICVGALAALILIGFVYWEGKQSEKGSEAIHQLENNDDARKTREDAERKARATPYSDMLDGLFGKTK